MACTPKPARKQWNRDRIKYQKEYKKKVNQIKVGSLVKSCGGIGEVIEIHGPHKPDYMMYGRYFDEYDLLVLFDGHISWHGLVDCTDLAGKNDKLPVSPEDREETLRNWELHKQGLGWWNEDE